MTAEEAHYARAWRQRRWRWIIGCIGIGLAVMMIRTRIDLGGGLTPQERNGVALGGVLIGAASVWLVGRFRCPRCGQSFDGYFGPYRAACRHCRLPANAPHDMPALPAPHNYLAFGSKGRRALIALAVFSPIIVVYAVIAFVTYIERQSRRQ